MIKRDYNKDPLRIIALCKTFRGEEFVEAMIESVINSVEKMVFIHSSVSWTGLTGNTVMAPVTKWKERSDCFDKIIQLNFDSKDQKDQYNFGVDFIKKAYNCDYIMFVDTDEVWEPNDIDKCKRFVELNPDCNAFTVNMRTYIKSPFYRLANIEPCKPTIFVKSSVTDIGGVRGNGVIPRINIPGVFMHHFTYVRKDDTEILNKVHSSTLADGLDTVDMKKWLEEKWDKIPYCTNFHTSKGYEHCWEKLETIDESQLPSIFRNHDFPIIRQFRNDFVKDIIKRHELSYKVIESNKNDMDLQYRRTLDSYELIKKYCTNKKDKILEIGCLTGHNLLNLWEDDYEELTGIELIPAAVKWGKDKAAEMGATSINLVEGTFPNFETNALRKQDKVIIFDVLEHVENQGIFLKAVYNILTDDGEVLFLVPKAREYFDPVHINFYPDIECLRNILTMHFKVLEMYESAR